MLGSMAALGRSASSENTGESLMTLSAHPGLPRSVLAARGVLPLDLAAYYAVHEFRDGQGRIGVPAVAAAYSWNPRTLTNKLNPNEERNVLSARELECIAMLTGDPRILDSLCSTMGAVWIPLPDGAGLSASAMLQQIGEASGQLGKLAQETGEAIADNRITEDELAVMEKTAMRITQAVQRVIAQARADIAAQKAR